VNHISSSILLNMCIKSLYPSLVLKDIIQVCNASLEEVTGRPIGLVSTGKGMFLERIKSKSCKWVRWMGMLGQKVSDSRDGLPVGAFVEGELHLSWTQCFQAHSCLLSSFFFFQDASQRTLPWLGDQWWQC
jgi:hypothetical protein